MRYEETLSNIQRQETQATERRIKLIYTNP